EPFRPGLDLADIEPRLDVEVVRAGAVLEIEVDQAGRAVAARGAAHEQHRRLDRQGGYANAARGRQERVNLGLGGTVRGGAFGDTGAGAHQLDGVDRLDQKIGDAQLDE